MQLSSSISDHKKSQPNCKLNMEASTTMRLPTVAGYPSDTTTFLSQVAGNGYSNVDRHADMSLSRVEESEPPMKRPRTSNAPLANIAPSISFDYQSIHVTPDAMPHQSYTGQCQISSILTREASGNGSSVTPNDSATTSTSLASSFGRMESTSPSTTPSQSLSTPSRTIGVRILDSNRVNISKCRPRSSIPSQLSSAVYGQQCVAAAYASRLNPYALHRKEQEALQDHLCHMHVTVYLNIRNGILRLWTRNPMVSVTREEALGCAKDYRWMDLASFAYDWLVRNGYINFGCVEVPVSLVPPRRGRRRDGPIIIVIGAGIGGLGCARQLEGLLQQYRDADTTPHVIVLEGRRRIGGRVYSHPLHSMQSAMLPPGLTPKAEMGAQIIVGFDNGNPLDQIVRGQLALHYHLLRDISTIYDIDGSPVHEVQDSKDEKLYKDILDRSGIYRQKALVTTAAEGDREMIENGRESAADDGLTVRQYEEARAAGTTHLLVPTKSVRRRRGVAHKTADIHTDNQATADLEGSSKEHPAASACEANGWVLNPGYTKEDTIELDAVAEASSTQTLGAVMDEGVRQYQCMLPLTPKDMRLLNWHFANLEYANAANISKLSLSGWDQDIGNEFEGEHSQVIGGYQQLPYGLYSLPTKLDVRTNRIVTDIFYDPSGPGARKAVVQCESGELFAADHVVFTGSLGTLKHQTIRFNPPLPEWKRGAIDRLGFGVMNKVVLVFDEPFWDTERDMFGLLREPTTPDSMNQEDYVRNRGRFYLFWNCIKTTGLPVLIALMAGDAAHQAERTSDSEIIAEVTTQLRNVFKHAAVPDPLETIITRWASDRFTRGSYSYVASDALPGDYDLMAQQVGNLYFAGEATCGTHPATVHGAYLSGLRAASEVMESILGPIEVLQPLVPERANSSAAPTLNDANKNVGGIENLSLVTPNTDNASTSSSRNSSISTDKVRRDAYDQAMWAAIHEEIGPPPARPQKAGLNPFLFYQKDYWARCRAQCDDARRASSNNPNAKAARDEIRHALGQMWRNASPAEKKPYLEQVEKNRHINTMAWDEFKRVAAEWDRRSFEVKDRWCAANPFAEWEFPQ